MLLAAALFGTTGTIVEYAPVAASPLALGAVRLGIGGPLLMVAAWANGAQLAHARRYLRSVIVGGVGVAAFQLLYFVATTRTGVALATVVTIGSGPVFSGLIHAATARQRPSRSWVIGTATGVCGVALLALTGDADAVDPGGVAAALGSGFGWASFTTLSKRQIDRGLGATLSLGCMFTAAAVMVAPIMFVQPMGWLTSGRGALIATYLGVATLTVAYTMYGRSLTLLTAPAVITLTLVEPVTAAVLAATVLGVRIAPTGWVGVALVMVALAITSRGSAVDRSRPAGGFHRALSIDA